MPETMGSGCAFLDYNNDGYQDIFFVNGRNWTPHEVQQYQRSPLGPIELEVLARTLAPHQPRRRTIPPLPRYKRTTGALYRNNQNGTFSDVTQGSGLDVEMYGQGAAVGDYDNNGQVDLYVTGYGRNYLFRNKGSGKFEEVAGQARVLDNGWSTSAAWLDYDKDGHLDLFVCRYLHWNPQTDIYRTFDGKTKDYQGPAVYPGVFNHLYHNEGNGQFTDVSEQTGISTTQPLQFDKMPKSVRAFGPHAFKREAAMLHHKTVGSKTVRYLKNKSLGVVVCDVNGDDWPDLIVADDREPNQVLRNNGKGAFHENGIQSGIGLNDAGHPRAGMGIDAADIDHSGREAIAIGNFTREMLGLYANQGGGIFVDLAPNTEVGRASYHFLTFGCVFADVDNDTWPDIILANGHVLGDAARGPDLDYAQRPLLFRNMSTQGAPRFQEVGLQSSAAWSKPMVARGLAYADIDLDGDLDVLFTTNGDRPLLLRNDTKRNDTKKSNNAIRLVLVGAKSNKSAIGARVEATVSGTVIHRIVRSGSSYLSQSELPLTIGLGKSSRIDNLVIYWPSDTITRIKNVAADQTIIIREGHGIISRQNLDSPDNAYNKSRVLTQ
jgi:hypothetical protein